MKIVSVLSMWLAFGQAQANAGAEHDAELVKQKIEKEFEKMNLRSGQRRLGDDSPRKIGEICGNDNPCEDSLDCVPAPLRKRCFPVTCATEAFTGALNETNFDMVNYGNNMLNLAGVNESQVFMANGGSDSQNLRSNDDFQQFINTVKENLPPIQLMQDKFNACNRASYAGVTGYGGVTWEVGPVAAYSGSTFWGRGTADTATVGVFENCFGFTLG